MCNILNYRSLSEPRFAEHDTFKTAVSNGQLCVTVGWSRFNSGTVNRTPGYTVITMGGHKCDKCGSTKQQAKPRTCGLTLCGSCYTDMGDGNTETPPRATTDIPSETGNLCMDTCIHNRNYLNKDMVRCCVCAAWIHTDCVSQLEEYVPGIWPCFECRKMPAQVNSLVTELTTLTRVMTTLLNENTKSTAEMNAMTKECAELKATNTELRKSTADLQQQLMDRIWTNFRTHTDNGKTLLVGTSIVKDIDDEKLVRTTVKSMSGGVISGIREAINDVTDPYDRIIIMAGGNDCDNDEETDVENIIKKFKLLIRDAKRISKHITVGTACPRNKGKQTTDNIDSF